MTQLQNLLTLAQQTPTDDKLLSQIAFAYLTTPYIKSDELTYFKRAYEVNPNIKNTHNYAFWASYEYDDNQLAKSLYPKLMDKNPNSFYPYVGYAQCLLGNTNSSKDFKHLKNTAQQVIWLYKQSLKKFEQSPKTYQNNHRYQLSWLYNNLANVYVVYNQFDNAKSHYQQALGILDLCFDSHTPKVHKTTLDEYRYFVLYNLLIMAKLQNNKHDYEKILIQLKTCQSFDNYDVFCLKRKSVNNLKRLLRYFYKCWLFGCEHCDNLADDDVLCYNKQV